MRSGLGAVLGLSEPHVAAGKARLRADEEQLRATIGTRIQPRWRMLGRGIVVAPPWDLAGQLRGFEPHPDTQLSTCERIGQIRVYQ